MNVYVYDGLSEVFKVEPKVFGKRQAIKTYFMHACAMGNKKDLNGGG